jgi:hypothetical protein
MQAFSRSVFSMEISAFFATAPLRLVISLETFGFLSMSEPVDSALRGE